MIAAVGTTFPLQDHVSGGRVPPPARRPKCGVCVRVCVAPILTSLYLKSESTDDASETFQTSYDLSLASLFFFDDVFFNNIKADSFKDFI